MRTTRRNFLKGAAAAAVIVPFGRPSLANSYAANSKVRHAGIGVQGMGGYDLREISSSPHVDVAFLCDIDDNHLNAAQKLHPKAQRYNDFRKLFDKESKNFDSCHVTVPDHMHGPIAMTAVKNGKHTYCQKPLCHEIYEARKLRLAAKEAGIVTQMGIQIHSHVAYRTGVQMIRDGAIGKVKSVHTWADRRWSNDGRPEPATPPKNVHWDLWLGVANERPWGQNSYHPKKWWSWLDFGTGNLGDMGCHLFDPVYSALGFTAPKWVKAECEAPKNETWPNSGKVFFRFPKTEYTAGDITMTWYDGGFGRGHHPAPSLLAPGAKLPSQGSIFIGEKGNMLLPHWKLPTFYPSKDFEGIKYPDVGQLHHWHQFVNAIRGEDKTGANWDFAGPFTETVLLGNLAKRFPTQKLKWDTENLKVKNFKEANEFTMRKYRDGWNIPGMNA